MRKQSKKKFIRRLYQIRGLRILIPGGEGRTGTVRFSITNGRVLITPDDGGIDIAYSLNDVIKANVGDD